MAKRGWLVALGLVELIACAGESTRSRRSNDEGGAGARDAADAGAAGANASGAESHGGGSGTGAAEPGSGGRASDGGGNAAGHGASNHGSAGRGEHDAGESGDGGAGSDGKGGAGSDGEGGRAPEGGSGETNGGSSGVAGIASAGAGGEGARASIDEPCSAGTTRCSGECVDTSRDPKNCGRCEDACALGTTCAASRCVASPGGDAGSDGCAGLARGVTLSQIAVYQSVEIPIMNAGEAIAAANRRADVVSGKAALFRLFVELERGFVPRQLSGRVHVENDGVVDVYSERKETRYSSRAYALESTFQVHVPKDKIRTGTRYLAELVECGAGTGAPTSPRFPRESGVDLGARAGAVLKVKLIPLRANDLEPDTSARALARYEAAALAVYPASSVELSVGRTIDVRDARDWNRMLDQVRARRQSESPADDVYYYGMVKPAATQREYCGRAGSCTTGLGFVVPEDEPSYQAPLRASVGLAYADAESAWTMLHELAHNHGREHAPCGELDSSDVDPAYPNRDGAVGGYGWDHRRGVLVDPYAYDFMSYCVPLWISAYTYGALLTRLTAVSAASRSPSRSAFPSARAGVAESALGPWRVLLVDERGARWGIPIPAPTPASGVPEAALALDRFGRVLEIVQVHRNATGDPNAASLRIPEPKPAWFSVQVAGADAVAFSD